jgi:DnaJ-class molecular chaperone
MDYYKILELDPVSASHEEITSSFRRLSLKYHPMKSADNLSSNQKEFSKVCEAYDVLSNTELKSTYDKFGPSGL